MEGLGIIHNTSSLFSTDNSQQRNSSLRHGDFYHLTIYSFLAAGGILSTIIVVLVVAILLMQYTRRKFLTSQLLTKEQKIAIMKQTGYVNPTYTFFDKHIDS